MTIEEPDACFALGQGQLRRTPATEVDRSLPRVVPEQEDRIELVGTATQGLRRQPRPLPPLRVEDHQFPRLDAVGVEGPFRFALTHQHDSGENRRTDYPDPPHPPVLPLQAFQALLQSHGSPPFLGRW
jgi:hypothetical protein